MLSELANCKYLRLVMTVDHVKAGVLFSDQSLDNFNFVCLQMDTFQDFEVENEYQPELFSAKNDN